jgi:hypothetical protein
MPDNTLVPNGGSTADPTPTLRINGFTPPRDSSDMEIAVYKNGEPIGFLTETAPGSNLYEFNDTTPPNQLAIYVVAAKYLPTGEIIYAPPYTVTGLYLDETSAPMRLGWQVPIFSYRSSHSFVDNLSRYNNDNPLFTYPFSTLARACDADYSVVLESNTFDSGFANIAVGLDTNTGLGFVSFYPLDNSLDVGSVQVALYQNAVRLGHFLITGLDNNTGGLTFSAWIPQPPEND